MTKSILIVLFLLVPVQIFAHAEEPAAKSIFKTENGILIQANFGIIDDFSDGYVCEEAFLGGDSWKVAVLDQTEWITYGSNNIKRTEDGCSFQTIKESDSIVGDIRVSPDKKTVAYYANGGSEPGIWVSKDRGKSFERIDFEVEGLQITALRFENNATMIISGYDTNQAGEGFLISVSTQSLESASLAIPDEVKFSYLLDANEEGLIWLGRLEAQTIFVGTRSETDQIQYEPKSWPIGAALSEDGQNIFIGGVENGSGIAVGSRSSGVFETILKDRAVDCLKRVGEKIYICGLERRDGYDIFELEKGSLKGVSKFTDIEGPKNSCPDESDVSSICPIVWKDTATYFGKVAELNPSPDTADMGVKDTDGNDQEPKTPQGPVEKSGCSTTASPSFPLVFLIGFLLFRKRS